MPLKKIIREELPALSALYEEFCGHPSNLGAMESVFEEIAHNGHYFLLGHHNAEGLLDGSILGILCPDLLDEGRPFMVVENVVVADSCRGQGVGKRLMDGVEEIARTHCCTYIILVSSGFRKNAHRFYETCGYTEDVRGFRKLLK